MSSEVTWVIVFVICLAVLSALLMDSLHFNVEEVLATAEEPPMLIPMDDTRLCTQGHSWNEAAFIDAEHYEDAKANPDKYPKTLFCTECGFVPALHQMVEPGYLNMVRAQLNYNAAITARVQMVEHLKAEFQKNYFQNRTGLTSGEIVNIKQGWDLYDAFLDSLPLLVEDYNEMAKLEADIRHFEEIAKSPLTSYQK